MNSAIQSYERVDEFYQRVIAGHVYIRDTIDALLETVGRQIESLGRTPRILELGSHTGIITQSLLARWPHVEVVLSEDDADLVAMTRRRLPGQPIEFHSGALHTLRRPVDLVVSVARHHHLPHDYLQAVHQVMKAGAVYVMADELCPEFCRGPHAARIETADVIHIVGGYVLTSSAEVEDFRRTGVIAAPAMEMERLRQQALWRWYRFVVDDAVERGYFDVAVSELQSTHDDLITGSNAEHKFSPMIVERQLSLAGFGLLSKTLIGPLDCPERQSMFVYEFCSP